MELAASNIETATLIVAAVGAAFGLLAAITAGLAIRQQTKHRRQDSARDVSQWAEETAQLASDVSQQWRRNLSGGERPDTMIEARWVETERRLRNQRKVLLNRLPEKLATAIANEASDLTTAASSLLTIPFYRKLQDVAYIGVNPFQETDRRPDWDSFGKWLDKTANHIIETVERSH